MEVTIEKKYPVAAPMPAAWAVLADMNALATCMPGAQITEQVDATHFKGSVRVKVGPAVAAFAGTIEILALDAASQTLKMLGKGADKGGSSASMELTAQLLPGEGGHCVLAGHAAVIVNGKFAQFGGRMMNSVSDMILAQFAEVFSQKAQALQAAQATPVDHSAAAQTGSDGSAPTPAPAPHVPAPVVATEFNALGLVWALIKNFFAGLFGKKTRPMSEAAPPPSPQGLREKLFTAGYIADEDVASLVWMALSLERPVLLEGEAGVGKTAVAAACARALGRPLLRLQCYEGLDLGQAVYEWNYSRQLLEIRLSEASGTSADKQALRGNLFSEEFLLERPLLQAIRSPEPCVLLIDEIDRADEAFEAFLLEMLSEFQISIPELGTLTARSKPLVILTSNGTRDLSDALRRRCLFHYLDFPSLAREMHIVRTLVPEAHSRLVEEAVAFVQRLRREDLDKTPGIAETLDWVRVLFKLGLTELPVDPAQLAPSLAALLKTRNDRWALTPERVGKLIDGPRIGQDVGVAGGMK